MTPPRSRRLRGLLAVIGLLASAVDALLSALTGWPRPSRVGRRFAAVIAATYRHAAGRPAPVPPLSIVAITAEDTTDDR